MASSDNDSARQVLPEVVAVEQTAHARPRTRTSSRHDATIEPTQTAEVQRIEQSTADDALENNVTHTAPKVLAPPAYGGPPPDPLLASSVMLASGDEYEQALEEATRREFHIMEQNSPDHVILRAARLQWCLHHLRPQALVADGNEEYASVRTCLTTATLIENDHYQSC